MCGGSLIVISAIAPSPSQWEIFSELHQLQLRLAHGLHGHLRPKNGPAVFKAELIQAFQGKVRFAVNCEGSWLLLL